MNQNRQNPMNRNGSPPDLSNYQHYVIVGVDGQGNTQLTRSAQLPVFTAVGMCEFAKSAMLQPLFNGQVQNRVIPASADQIPPTPRD